jgi:hypothetical protein
MVTPEERAALFQLALPELGRIQLRDDSTAVLEAFSRLKSLTKPLWTATSIEDVLTTASEQIADWFDGALLVSSTRRREPGVWDDQVVDDKHVRNEPSNVIRDMTNHLPTSEYDALDFYPRLANAGDVGTPDLYPPQLQRDILNVYARHRVAGFAGFTLACERATVSSAASISRKSSDTPIPPRISASLEHLQR